MVSKQQLIRGIENYIDSEILPRLPVTEQIALGVYVQLAKPKAEAIADDLMQHSLIKPLALVDESGNVDIQRISEALVTTINKRGSLEIKLPMLGLMRFNSIDVTKLVNCIQGGAV